jgi:hypothetical protein
VEKGAKKLEKEGKYKPCQNRKLRMFKKKIGRT